jgi:hypothetical protein
MKKILFLILMMPVLGRAQLSSCDISGYVKYLSSVSDYPAVNGTLYDQLLHARINTAWYPLNSFRGALDVRLRAFYGDSIEKVPRFIDQLKTGYDFTDLDMVLWDARKTYGYVQIDRLWLNYSLRNLDMTLGRQRIAWGTALVWNVIDLYNPKSVLDFDYEEKSGADAFRLQYYTGAVTKMEVAAKPGKTMKTAIIAGLYSINMFQYDFYGIAGIRNDRWVAGAAWAGDILKAGFRGEFLVSQTPQKMQPRINPVPPDFGSSIFTYDKTVVSFVLSGDYTFPNSFYIHTECLFNSNGKINNAGVFRQEALDAGMLSPARWSLYQEFGYDITPLTRTTLFGIFNPNDHSWIVVPMLTQSIKTDLDLLLIGLLASGDTYSEFGDYGKSVFLRLKFSY